MILFLVVIEIGDQAVGAPEDRHVGSQPSLFQREEGGVPLQALILDQQWFAVEVRDGDGFLEVDGHARPFEQSVDLDHAASAPVAKHVACLAELNEQLLFVEGRAVLELVPLAPIGHPAGERRDVEMRDGIEIIAADLLSAAVLSRVVYE